MHSSFSDCDLLRQCSLNKRVRFSSSSSFYSFYSFFKTFFEWVSNVSAHKQADMQHIKALFAYALPCKRQEPISPRHTIGHFKRLPNHKMVPETGANFLETHCRSIWIDTKASDCHRNESAKPSRSLGTVPFLLKKVSVGEGGKIEYSKCQCQIEVRQILSRI